MRMGYVILLYYMNNRTLPRSTGSAFCCVTVGVHSYLVDLWPEVKTTYTLNDEYLYAVRRCLLLMSVLTQHARATTVVGGADLGAQQ